MNPIKGILPFAMWLLRLSILLFAFAYFFPEVKGLSFSGLHYFVALAYTVFSILLFIGGFVSKHTLTVFSGLMIFAISAYKLFDLFDLQTFTSFSPFVLVAALGLLFAAIGNKT